LFIINSASNFIHQRWIMRRFLAAYALYFNVGGNP